MEEMPLYRNGVPCGRVRIGQEGLHRIFELEGTPGEEIEKLWLCAGGREHLLGTPIPEGGVLRLRRRVSEAELHRLGLERIERCELRGSRGAGIPIPLEPELARAFAALPAGLWERWGDGWRWSISWQVGQAFPVTRLFCFAKAEEGRVTYFFDANGKIRIHEWGAKGAY